MSEGQVRLQSIPVGLRRDLMGDKYFQAATQVPLTQELYPLPGWVCPGIACAVDFLPDSGV